MSRPPIYHMIRHLRQVMDVDYPERFQDSTIRDAAQAVIYRLRSITGEDARINPIYIEPEDLS